MDTAALPYSHGYAGIGQAKAPIESESTKAKDNPAGEDKFWGDDGFTFGDVIDLINPLQHLPIVSTIYRAITNDEIAPGPRMAGGALFGGPLGFASALASTLVEEATGKDVGEHLMALAGFGPDEVDSDVPLGDPGNAEKVRVASAAISNPTPALVGTEAATPASTPAPLQPPTASAPAAADRPPTHAVQPGALAKYENTVWGALLAAQQSDGTGNRRPLQALSMPASVAKSDGKPKAAAADTATEHSAQWQVENLTAQELAERLLLYSKAFQVNVNASN